MARWRSCVSPAAIACVVRRVWRRIRPPSTAKPAIATAMKGSTLAGDLAAGLARVPGEARDGIALRVGDDGHLADRRVGRRHRPARKPDNCSWSPIPCSRSLSMYLIESTIGALRIAGGEIGSRSRRPPPRRSPVCPAPARSGRRSGRLVRVLRADTGSALAGRRRAVRAAKSTNRRPARGGSVDRSDDRRRRARAHIRHGRSRPRSRQGRGRRKSSSQGRAARPPIADRISRASPAWRRSVAATLSTSRNTRAPRSTIACSNELMVALSATSSVRAARRREDRDDETNRPRRRRSRQSA